MANTENLMPIEEVNSRRTREQHSKDSSKGGKKSGQVRRTRKLFKELFNSYLDQLVTLEDLKQQMIEFGFKEEECTNKNAMVMSQYKEALKGSTQAYVAVRDSIGEKPVEQIEMTQPPTIKIERPKEE